MIAVENLCWSFALIALLGAALATIAGAASVRDRFFGAAVGCIVLALAVPVFADVLHGIMAGVQTPDVVPTRPDSGGSDVPWGGVLAVVVGHIVLAIVLLRRRLRGAEAARRDAAELEAVRGRERQRLQPDGEDAEP